MLLVEDVLMAAEQYTRSIICVMQQQKHTPPRAGRPQAALLAVCNDSTNNPVQYLPFEELGEQRVCGRPGRIFFTYRTMLSSP